MLRTGWYTDAVMKILEQQVNHLKSASSAWDNRDITTMLEFGLAARCSLVKTTRLDFSREMPEIFQTFFANLWAD